MNSITIYGRLGGDPQIRQVKDANVTTFTIADTSRRKGADGQQITNWFTCSAWRQVGETIAKYCHKGDSLMIVGDLVMRPYKDKNGQDRTSIEVTVSDMAFGEKNRHVQPDVTPAAPQQGDDELPF